jgi:hypothetical protein
MAVIGGCSFKQAKELAPAGLGENGDPAARSVELRATYASIRENIIVPKCLRCHTGPSSPHGINLENYKTTVHSHLFPPLVEPGYPEKSSFYTACESGDMPDEAPKLSDAELRAIFDWIKDGAKETPDVVQQPRPSPLPSTAPSALPGEPGDDDPVPAPVPHPEPCDTFQFRNEPGFKPCALVSEPGAVSSRSPK